MPESFPKVLLVWFLLLGGTSGMLAPSSPTSPLKEIDVKAAYVANFAKLVEWQDVPGEVSSELPICTLSEIPLTSALRRIAAGQTVNGRIARVRVEPRPDPSRCRVLVVDAPQYRAAGLTLRSLRGQPILTVGDGEGFLEAGGAFQFVISANRVLFDASLPAIREARLDVSARLLRLARRLIHEERAAS
jgi:hypothetical protein